MKNIAIVVLAFSFFACATKPKRVGSEPETASSEFEQGLRALEAEDYESAATIFDRLLVEKPASELDLVAIYNSGAAYEGLTKCKVAAERYRQVVRSSAGKFTRIEGEALFRLSVMYGCLGQDTKEITALLDARKRGKDLPPEIVDAEIPARLAAAYARIGNRTKALQFFTQASRGLKGVVKPRDGRKVQTERVARTLFLMGSLSPNQRRGEVDPETFLQSIAMQQPYLLQAMEMDHPVWSGKASDDLQNAYDNVWKFKIEDPNKRREFYTRAVQTINELRKIRMPRPEPRIDAVFAMLDKTESRLQTELSQVAEQNRLTPEAERRQGLKRTGRLVNPEPEASPDGAKKKKPIRK